MEYAIRTYQAADLPVLSDFLNANFDYDQIAPELLEEKLTGDPYWDAQKALICNKGTQILGFMQGVIRDIRGTRYGYIKLMAVHAAHRRQGIARSLYARLEKELAKEEIDIVRIYDVPMNYFMPGIDPRYTEALCFAMRMGFKRFGDTSNLLVDLDHTDWATDQDEKNLEQHGITVQRPQKDELSDIIAFVEEDWALWKHEIEMAFHDDPPSIHVAYLHGKVKAFSAHNANNKGTGWFGPMGTHPDLRGKGIGGILLKRCLKDMKEMGMKLAIIPWVGPIDFYAHHANARVDRVFWRFEKHLKK